MEKSVGVKTGKWETFFEEKHMGVEKKNKKGINEPGYKGEKKVFKTNM